MELITCSQTQKDSISTFDTLCTHPRIQRLKILIPFLSPSMQGIFAFYIKFMELKYTIQLLQNHTGSLFTNINPDISQVCDELDPFLSDEEKDRVKSMKNMYQSFSEMKDMMEMVNSMKEMFPDGFDMGSMGDMPGMEGMEGIFNMMNQFGGMNNNGTDT